MSPFDWSVAGRAALAYKFAASMNLDFSNELQRLMDPYWRKARIAARLLIKREDGRPWSARDRRLATQFALDSSVTNRLLDQAYHSHRARRRNGTSILGWFR